MGGGNGQKSATARIRNQERMAKIAKGGQSQLKANAQAQNIQCQICRATFLCTATKAKLQEHVDGKHPKATYEACFAAAGAA